MPKVFRYFSKSAASAIAAPPPAGFSNDYSLLFGGTDEYVDVAAAGDIFSIGASNFFSISCWFKWVGTPTGNGEDGQGIVSYRPSINLGFGFFWMSATTLRFRVESFFNNLSLEIANPNIWHHICGTLTDVGGDNTIRTYLDGAAVGGELTLGPMTLTKTTSHFAVGRNYPSNPAEKYATGNIDEVAVWNVGLTPEEVTTLYNGGVVLDLSTAAPQQANLKLYWRMGDGDTYPTILDSSGTGNTGTMQNMESGDIVADVP